MKAKNAHKDRNHAKMQVMYIVEVLPISRSAIKDSLSYFSSFDIPRGSVISVPVRNKFIQALVLTSKPAIEGKIDIKELPYTLKKLENTESRIFLRNEFIEAAHKVASYHASFTGPVLSTVIPKRILENISELTSNPYMGVSQENLLQTHKEVSILQAHDSDRFADYKSLIRESFARKKSVFFCVPTLEDARQALEKLEKGIEEYTFILDSSLTKKDTLFAWNKALETAHPVLIIGTGMFLCIPREDLGTIIIEKESSRVYKTQTRPFVDMRLFAETYSKLIKAHVILGDNMLRTETLFRYHNHEVVECTPLKWRSLTTATDILVDMRVYNKKAEKKFKIFSDEAEESIKEARQNNGRVFVFGARRGLSPQVVCNDCGTTVLCSRCSAPVVLHGGDDKKNNFFLCHKCGEKKSADQKCSHCSGWNLVTLGIGIEGIEKELKIKFPETPVFRIDYDTVKNHKKAKEIARAFYKTAGAILLGTEMALLYMDEPLECSIVASIDSLFAIPDFRGNEKIMSILLKLRNISQKKFIVQTRAIEENTFEYALKGNIADFYKNEISERESFAYPPFVVLIKITYQGKREEVLEEMQKLKSFLAPYNVLFFPAFIETVKGKFVMHALIKAEKVSWPDRELTEKLMALPHYFVVKIDPDNLL